MCASVHTHEREGVCGASKAEKDAGGTIYGAKSDKFKKTFPKGKIGADEDIFSRCEVTKSAAYSAYVSICGASKAGKDASGTIYDAKRDSSTEEETIKQDRTIWNTTSNKLRPNGRRSG